MTIPTVTPWRMCAARRSRFGPTVLVGAVLTMATACASSSADSTVTSAAADSNVTSAAAGSTVTSGAAGSTAPAASTAPAGPAGGTPGAGHDHGAGGPTTITFADNGATVTVPRGTAVVLRLDSTYWTIAPASDPHVLAGTRPVVTSDGRRKTPPGMGAGIATEKFRALSAGTARLRATRTSCGEALRCSPAQGSFAVTVVVT